jgi:5'-nucleotidase/UDP-sugar diphosphatase
MNWKLVLAGMVVAALLWNSGLWTQEEPQLELTLLHTNDVHSHYEPFARSNQPVQGGAVRLATLVQNARQAATHSLFLDAGDQFQGSLLFTVGGTDVVADVMNALDYDAMAIGNHEFDLGPAELARFIDAATFSVVSANVDASADINLDGKIRPFDVFLFGGEIVGVFGLTTETTATASSPGDDVVFEPTVRRARSIVAMLERQGVNKIVAVTHLGFARDLELAAAVDGIDVIVGGHSHTQLGAGDLPYPTLVTSSAGEPVVVVTAGEWGEALGRLDVVFDAEGVVVEATGELIPVAVSVPEVESVVALLAPYAAEAKVLLRDPVGTIDVDLDGDRARVRSEETNLGDAIADAMLWKTSSQGARVALHNGGGVRASIPRGPVTLGQILEVLPFGNEVSLVTVTGRQLVDALENGVSQVEGGAGRFPQVSGLRFSFDPAAAAGARVRVVEVWDPTLDAYRALLPEESFIVATNDFLAGGGDGYMAFAGGVDRYDTGWLLSDVLAEYVREHSPLRVEVDGRIRIADSEPANG